MVVVDLGSVSVVTRPTLEGEMVVDVVGNTVVVGDVVVCVVASTTVDDDKIGLTVVLVTFSNPSVVVVGKGVVVGPSLQTKIEGIQ